MTTVPRRACLALTVVLASAVASTRADTLVLREGGLLEGRYAGGTGDVVQFTIGDQARYFPVSVVAQLIVTPRGTESGTPAGSGAAQSIPDRLAAGEEVTLRLRDGSVFKGAYRGGTAPQVFFQVFGEVRSFEVAQVAAIEFVPPATNPPPAAPQPFPAPQTGGTRGSLKKSFFGGGFGLGYGDISWIEVWPVFGYRVTPNITAGVELLYRARDDDRYARDINATDYGASPFVRFSLVRGVFVQAGYEYLSYEYVDAGLSTRRDQYDSLLLGAGLSRPMGGHAAFVVSTFYNFSYSDNDPYGPYDEPWIVNAGVGFGF